MCFSERLVRRLATALAAAFVMSAMLAAQQPRNLNLRGDRFSR